MGDQVSQPGSTSHVPRGGRADDPVPLQELEYLGDRGRRSPAFVGHDVAGDVCRLLNGQEHVERHLLDEIDAGQKRRGTDRNPRLNPRLPGVDPRSLVRNQIRLGHARLSVGGTFPRHIDARWAADPHILAVRAPRNPRRRLPVPRGGIDPAKPRNAARSKQCPGEPSRLLARRCAPGPRPKPAPRRGQSPAQPKKESRYRYRCRDAVSRSQPNQTGWPPRRPRWPAGF